MVLKIISYIAGISALISGGIYLYVYDQMTREPLKILWVDSAATTDLRNILDEFTDATNITVLVEGVPRKLYHKVIEREINRSPRSFDVVIGDTSWLTNGVSLGWYENITPLVRTSWLVKNPGDLLYANARSISGDYYAVPISLDTLGIAYSKQTLAREENRIAFREKYNRELSLPTTLAELVDIASFFSEYEAGKYRVVMPPLTENFFASTLFFSALTAQGGSLFDSTTKVSAGHINTRLAAEVLEQLRTLVQAGVEGNDTSLLNESVLRLDSFDNLDALQKNDIDFAYTAFPSVTDTHKSFVVQYVASVVADTSNKRAAHKFITWWQSKKGQELWKEQRGFSEVYTESVDEYSYPTAYNAATKNGVSFVDIPNNELIREMLQNYLTAYLQGKTTFTAQETLDTIATAWDRFY